MVVGPGQQYERRGHARNRSGHRSRAGRGATPQVRIHRHDWLIGDGREPVMTASVVIEPRTGEAVGPGVPDTSPTELELVLAAAARAARAFGGGAPASRAGLLRALAERVEHHSGELVALAGRETGLPEARLTGEVARTSVPAAAVRRGRRRRLVPRGDAGHARPDDDATASRAPAGARAAGPGARVRGQQLPLRVQRRRRRHGLGTGSGVPGGAQGTWLASRALRANGRSRERTSCAARVAGRGLRGRPRLRRPGRRPSSTRG